MESIDFIEDSFALAKPFLGDAQAGEALFYDYVWLMRNRRKLYTENRAGNAARKGFDGKSVGGIA
jgi:hypothetical protein